MRLSARLVQPGRSGSWVAGRPAWSRLACRFQDGYQADAVQLLQELYAVYHSSGRPAFHGYGGYGDEKSIDLCGFESGQLGPCSTDAGGRHPAALQPQARPGADLPVRRAVPGHHPRLTGSLAVAPVIRIEETSTRLRPVAFIGAEGHGLVYVDPGEADRGPDYTAWRFGLARLARGVPSAIQKKMALAGQRLEIPAAELPRFRDDFYPRRGTPPR